MAHKRMLSPQITDTDAFLEMSPTAQNYYFHLNLHADDDGFVANPKKILKMVNASEDDLKILLVKRFVIGFASGIIVIKHWRIHNTLRNDRYTPTAYQEEYQQLSVKDNKSYTEIKNVPEIRELVSDQMASQIRLGKTSANKNSVDIVQPEEKNIIPPTYEMVSKYCKERNNKIDPQAFIDHNEMRGWKPKGSNSKIKNWQAAIRTWERYDKMKNDKTDDYYKKFSKEK
jgi:hypothetical protein